MSKLNLYVDPNNNFLKIQSEKKLLPQKIYEVLIAKEKIIVRFSGNANEEELKTKELLNAYIDTLNHNIWCFDYKGNLVWKIPGAYSNEQHSENLKKHGSPLSASYVAFFQYADDENMIIAFTGYGDRVFIRIADGVVVKQDKKGK